MIPAIIERRDGRRCTASEFVSEEGDEGEEVDEGEADTQTEATMMKTRPMDTHRSKFGVVTFATSRVPDAATLAIARRVISRQWAQLRQILA